MSRPILRAPEGMAPKVRFTSECMDDKPKHLPKGAVCAVWALSKTRKRVGHGASLPPGITKDVPKAPRPTRGWSCFATLKLQTGERIVYEEVWQMSFVYWFLNLFACLFVCLLNCHNTVHCGNITWLPFIFSNTPLYFEITIPIYSEASWKVLTEFLLRKVGVRFGHGHWGGLDIAWDTYPSDACA